MKFNGSQVVYDPMCGSGTIVIEAAEIALGLLPLVDKEILLLWSYPHLKK